MGDGNPTAAGFTGNTTVNGAPTISAQLDAYLYIKHAANGQVKLMTYYRLDGQIKL